MNIKIPFFLTLFLFTVPISIFAQTPCAPPEIVFNKNAYNIFDETQEMYLGEVVAETFEKNYRLIDDEAATSYVRAIGEKVAKHLPPTNIKFRFSVIDEPDTNAFTIAGGRIYVTRKMIAFVRSEDELAGVIGHELGHAIVRHAAIDMSKYFKEILGVEKVGDRQDIFEKYNQLIDRQRTKRVRISSSHEDNQQLEADRIGLFAMTAAGYDPKAFVAAMDRLIETKGKTGSSLSDFFGTTRPEEKRLREILGALSAVPPECLDKRTATTSESFEKWQSYVVTTSNFRRAEKLKALLAKKSLNPYLRADVRYFQFSPDGNFIIAQDASGINVLRRDPFQLVFRIETTDAKPATFSPDSKFISFSTYGLRVEKWSVETKKPVMAREVNVRDGCWQSLLSPDGKFLACYTGRWSLDIINVETGEKAYSKERFYVPSDYEIYIWEESLYAEDRRELKSFQMTFSPDGRYFLGARVLRAGFLSIFNLGGQDYSAQANLNQDSFLAYDLQGGKEIKLGGELKYVISQPFAFYANDRIIGQHRESPEKSGIFTFPGGERLDKFLLSAESFTKPFQGDYIFVRPTSSNPVGVYDLPSKKFIAANKTAALDGYGDYFISEGKDGIVEMLKLDRATLKMNEIGEVTLPKNKFGAIQTVALAPNLDWLALSERSRGAIWDLKTGAMKIYIRGFRGSFIDADGSVYAELPEFEKEPRSLAMINPVTNVAGSLGAIEKKKARQYGKYFVRTRSKIDEEIEKKLQEKAANGDKDDKKENKIERQKQKMELEAVSSTVWVARYTPVEGSLVVEDVRTQKELWSRYFPNELPKCHFDSTAETAVLYWQVKTKTAQEEIKNDAVLKEKQKTLGEKDGDYLVEVLDANTGVVRGKTLIETGERSFAISSISAAGDWLTIVDSENRVLVYSISNGELRQRFFGGNAAICPTRPVAAVENSEGQLSVYDLETGRKTDELQFSSAVAYAVFGRDGKKLFVLTADQTYYLFNVDGLALK